MSYIPGYQFADAAVTLLDEHVDLDAFTITRCLELPGMLSEYSLMDPDRGEIWVKATEDEPEIAGLGDEGVDYVRPLTLEVLMLSHRAKPDTGIRTAKTSVEECLLNVKLANANEPLTPVGGWEDRSLLFGELTEAHALVFEFLYCDERATVGYERPLEEGAGSPIGLLLTLTKAA